MLTSLAVIFLLGLFFGWLLQKLHLPELLGMLITGMLVGPYALNLLDGSILGISPELRRLALLIILMRAGLNMDVEDLKKAGRPAVLMCFVLASFEMAGMIILAPRLLGVSVLDAAIMGAVVAAVSPAVVVPRMLKLMEEGYGKKQSIPQLVMAGASVDDVFVIVIFTALTGLAGGGQISPASFLQIPVSIALGLAAGILLGIIMAGYFKRFHIRDSVKVLIMLSIAFILTGAEDALNGTVPFSGLLAVMAMGVSLQQKRHEVAERLSAKFSKLWVCAEVLLFVLVGAAVDMRVALTAGGTAAALVLGALVFRMAGVFCCLLGTKLDKKERLFCMIAYMPKATVQASIGSIPLAMGLPCGQTVLTVAVAAILLTAPLGALGVDITYRKLLHE